MFGSFQKRVVHKKKNKQGRIWKVSADWRHKKWGEVVCQGTFGIFSWLMSRSGLPSMGLWWKEEGKTVGFGTDCQGRRGGGVKASAQSLQYEDATKRSLSRPQMSAELLFEADQPAKGRTAPLRTRRTRPPTSPATPQQCTRHTTCRWRTSLCFRSKHRGISTRH